MVTLENVLEKLVDPIQDEFDNETPRIIRRGTGKFEVDASSVIGELIKKLSIELAETWADTIGGVVIDKLGRIPQKSEKVPFADFEITVIDAEPKRINRP